MRLEPTLTRPEPQGNMLTNCHLVQGDYRQKNNHNVFLHLSSFTNSTTNADEIVRKTGSSFA